CKRHRRRYGPPDQIHCQRDPQLVGNELPSGMNEGHLVVAPHAKGFHSSRYIPPYKRKELAELAADGQSLAPQRGTRHLEESFSPTALKGRSAWGQGSLVNRESSSRFKERENEAFAHFHSKSRDDHRGSRDGLIASQCHQDRRFSSSAYADDRTSFGRRRFGSASFVERGSSFSSLSGFARRTE
ncbi:hypothetical protein FOZ62_030820, partial [Perkinsus olseni]